jgi:hypothetical protein
MLYSRALSHIYTYDSLKYIHTVALNPFNKAGVDVMWSLLLTAGC